MTDNAFAYRGHATARICRWWAIRHRFTRPYRPQTNGKAERLIQTLLWEWAYRVAYRTPRRADGSSDPSASTTIAGPTPAWPMIALDSFPRGCVMNNLFDIHSLR